MSTLPSQNPEKLPDESRAIHERLQNDLAYFAKRLLKIKPKTGPLEPFIFNTAQEYLHGRLQAQNNRLGKVRVLIVKGRQQGCSTYVAARYYHRAVRNQGQSVFILSHESQTTEKLFNIVDRYHENVPDVAKPHAEIHNRRQLKFDQLGSDYSVGTAGNEDVGRGGTIQLFHGSEVAFWGNTDQIQTGILQSVPDLPGTEVILESTANGMSNMFYDLVKEAQDKKNDYEVVFIPWYWQAEYRRNTPPDNIAALTTEEEEYCRLYSQDPYKKVPLDKEQMYWRRAKISEFKSDWKFKQEYPAYLDEAFQTSGETLILPQAVIRARKNVDVELDRRAPLIVGFDPGRTRDRSVFVWRRGNVMLKYKIYTFSPEDRDNVQMVLAGLAAQIIGLDNPDAMNIDVGEGNGIIDRLREMGYSQIVHGVHFGESPLDEIYLNKRAEMFCLMRDWYHGDDGPVRCPDDDIWHRDMCAMPAHKLTSSGKIQLVSSEVIRAKVKMSLDIASAAALTFAYPVRSRMAEDGPNRIHAKRGGVSELKTLQKRRNESILRSRQGGRPR